MALLFGCATNQQKFRSSYLQNENRIPPGIDSLLAIKADSLSSHYFVDFSQKMQSGYYVDQSKKYFQISDSLWRLCHLIHDTTRENVESDSLNIKQLYRKCRLILEPNSRDNNQCEQPFPEFSDVRSSIEELLKQAKEDAKKARYIDPYSLNARINYIEILNLLGKVSDEDDCFKQAAEELNKFLKFEKSQHKIYALLAECHYSLKKWEDAYSNFKKAQAVLEQTAIFKTGSQQPATLDTALLVYYLEQQGDTRAKMYDDSSALNLLNQALQLTESLQKRRQIQNYIDWINWDDGNIRAVERRDYCYKLLRENRFKKASKEFKKLLKILQTRRTRNQINWKIATINFEVLNNKNDGIKRLFDVVKDIPPENRADSTSMVYLTDYGAMCYQLGLDYLQRKEYKIAYAYFKQASKIDWEKRAESYFQLAQLSQSDSEETIKNCHNVLAYEADLSKTTLKKTYQLLVNAYKRNGNFELARNYHVKLSQMRL
ncbi:hypothetical protein GF337_01675 [candidate division KSB1 bacterium]|nr:hypothetical protein [candidate division KSB1 bacterium]